MNEPYRLGIKRIRRMTDAGIYFLLFHPRNKDGTLDRGEWVDERGQLAEVRIESLRIPDEAMRAAATAGTFGMPPDFLGMWWQVARTQQQQYGWSDEHVLKSFLAYVEKEKRACHAEADETVFDPHRG